MEGQIGLEGQIIGSQKLYYNEKSLAEMQNYETGEQTSQSRDHLEREIRKLDGLLSVFRT